MYAPAFLFLLGISSRLTVALESDDIPLSTREHWMRRAIDALSELTDSPCPSQAFGAAIVNHTDTTTSEHGELICIGANSVFKDGNPVLHGMLARSWFFHRKYMLVYPLIPCHRFSAHLLYSDR
jgi:hypothetical protein